jgi:hypothetical protein
MTAKKRPIPKPKTVIHKYSAQRLTIRSAKLLRLYAELLRLRQAVRQAESQTRRAKVDFDLQ